MQLESSINSLLKELQEKNDTIVELLEEQQLVLKQAEEFQLHNQKLESIVMRTAGRMRNVLESNKRKDQVVEKLEMDIQNLQQRYEKESRLLQIQLDNHNEKEIMMSDNLTYYLDENTRLKNERRVASHNDKEISPSDSSGEEKGQIDIAKIYEELSRFK